MSLRKMLLVSGITLITAPIARAAESGTSNAVWLGHAFVTTDSVVRSVPRTASFLTENKVDYWFVNIGRLNREGRLPNGGNSFPRVREFLAAVQAWERANNHPVKVLAWLNGNIDNTDDQYINVGDANVRAAMLDECRKLIDPATNGSYIAGSTRAFDGVQFDLEPAGADDSLFAGLRLLMDGLRQAIGPGKLTSFAANKLGTGGRYWWSPTYYHYMARRVDLLCAMTYDSGIKNPEEYRAWMAAQTKDILNAVSGATWKNDEQHPAPKNGVQVLIGFPAFPPNQWHDPLVETTRAAAQGARDALQDLSRNSDPSFRFFGGSALYLYTDGSGLDNYSGPREWAAFQEEWLGRPRSAGGMSGAFGGWRPRGTP